MKRQGDVLFRLAYVVGFGYLAICAGSLLTRAASRPPDVMLVRQQVRHQGAEPQPQPTGPAGWFASIRARCNAVEVEVALRSSPAPAGDEGESFRAGCYALAGKIDRAKATIDALAAGARPRAAAIVFDIVHPVADAGDDKSAGPMMRLVLDYAPDNFMAVYHAGMSEHAVGDNALAHKHLTRFLQLYTADDGWTRNAREVLARPEVAAAGR